MEHEPRLWRNRKPGGREYGAWRTYVPGVGGVNLKTTIRDEALKKARQLLEGATNKTHSAPSPETSHAVAPSALPFTAVDPPRFSWSGYRPSSPAAGVGSPPVTTPAAPAEPPKLSPAMEGLAEGLATAIARFNGAAAVLAVKYLGNVKAKPDPSELEALEKTWTIGAKEILAKTGFQWWHMLIIQNGTMVVNMLASGEKLPPKIVAPVAPAPAPVAA